MKIAVLVSLVWRKRLMVGVYAAVVSAGCAELITLALINYSLFTGVSCKTTRSSIHHSPQYLHGGPPDPDVVIRATMVARGQKKTHALQG